MIEISELHPSERAVIVRFAEKLAHSYGRAVMSVREILTSRNELPHVLVDGMKRLSDRGWLVCGGSMGWNDEDHCILIAEGLMLAVDQADKLRGSKKDPPESDSGADAKS